MTATTTTPVKTVEPATTPPATSILPPVSNQVEKDLWQLTLHAGMRYVNLTWNDPCGNEQGFNIERSDDGINWINVGSARKNATTFSDRGVQEQSNVITRLWAFLFGGLMRGNTYYYRVMAFNSEGIICTSPVAWISTR